MSIFILLIVTHTYAGNFVHTQTFTSQERCEFAKIKILELGDITKHTNNDKLVAECVAG